jgi:hypothetical protein
LSSSREFESDRKILPKKFKPILKKQTTLKRDDDGFYQVTAKRKAKSEKPMPQQTFIDTTVTRTVRAKEVEGLVRAPVKNDFSYEDDGGKFNGR